MIHNEQALHTGIECFALQSAGVGNDFFCMLREMHRIGIPNWLRKNDVFKAVPLAQTQRTGMVARMHRVDRRRIQIVHSGEYLLERFVAAGVFLPVAGHEVILLRHAHAVAVKVQNVGVLPRLVGKMQKRIVHDVAHEVRLGGEIFLPEIFHAGLRRREKKARAVVCADAVNLFGVVVRAETVARFHMQHGDHQLHRRERRGQRGVRVAVHEKRVRRFGKENLFDLDEHASGHFAMRSAGDAEVIVRPGDSHLLKEDVRHIGVIVLTGVDKNLSVFAPESTRTGRSFDKLRPGSDDGNDLHFRAPRCCRAR